MVEGHKKSESEVKVNVNEVINTLMDAVNVLDRRVKHLESEILALQRADNSGFKHQNDGGWFD
jgi:chaperonin cofactor prefoldin